MINKSTIYSMTLIIFLGLLVYINSLNNPFIWDDEALISDNYLIKDLKYVGKIFKTNLTFASGNPTLFYRPMQNLTYLLDYYIFGLRPWGFRVTNIILHILNAILVYFIIFEFTHKEKISFFVSTLFVVHPINTEAVTYISGRADPLMGLFLLIAFLSYIKYRISKTSIFYLVSLISFILGILSKELAVIFPLVILVYELYLLKIENKRFRLSLFNMVPFLIFSLGYIILRLNSIKGYFTNLKYPLPTRILVFITNIPNYLRILFMPEALHMGRSVVLFKWEDFLRPSVFFSVSLIVLIMAGTILSYKKKNFFIAFWISWFFIFLLPQSGLFPINAFFAEHFIYLSSVGFFAVFCYFLIKYLPRPSSKYNTAWGKGRGLPKVAGIIIFVVLLLFYGFKTIQRNYEWKNPVKFYESLVKRSPFSFAGYNNLGIVYADLGFLDKAQDAFKKAIIVGLGPESWEAHINRAKVFYKKGKVGEAINQCLAILKENPNLLYGHTVLGGIYADEKMYFQAITEFNTAIKLHPEVPGIYNSLGLVYRQMKDYDLAIGEFKKAIALDRKNENSYNNLGLVYKDKAQYQLAIDNYFKALKINRNLAQTHSNLGVVYGLLQRFNDAETEFKQAIKLKPDYVEAYFNLGSLYWQAGRPGEAKISWQEVLRLEPENKLASEWLHKLEK